MFQNPSGLRRFFHKQFRGALFICLFFCVVPKTEGTPTTYAEACEQRRQQLLDRYATNSARRPHVELIRLARGDALDESVIHEALDFIEARLDTADFKLPGILRLLYKYGDDPRVNGALAERAHQVLVHIKYWPDEPGIDSMCTWTENQ